MNRTKDTGRCFFRTSVLRAGALLVLACGLLAGPAWAQHFEAMEYYHYDALGSVRLVVSYPHDSMTYTISRHDYLPFGEEIQPGTFGRARNLGYGTGDTTPQRFTGKERDPESNLDYFGARYYSGGQGRFTSADPANASAGLGNPQSWNGYSYSLNSPLRLVDPTGKAPEDVNEALLGALRDTLVGQVHLMSGLLMAANPGPTSLAVDAKVNEMFPLWTPENQLQANMEPGFHGLILLTSLVLAEPAGADPVVPEATEAGATSPTLPQGRTPAGRQPGPTVDAATGHEVRRFVVDGRGNAMIEPAGGETVPAGPSGADTHTLYPNKSNYQRLNPNGHRGNPTPHGHGHLPGTGPGRRGQGPSLDPRGRVVKPSDPDAHWPVR